MKLKITLAVIGFCIVIGGFIYWGSQPGKLDTFATCLKDQGATFFGAFWCPHCQEQKALFGKSRILLPYVECSTPDGGGQTQACKDKKIESYPTWEFANGSRQSGVLSIVQLAEKTSCSLLDAVVSTSTTSTQ